MWQKIGNIILRNRLFIITVILLLTAVFGYFAVTKIKIDNKYGNTLPKDAEVQIQYLKFKENFGEDGSTLVIAIDNKKLYTEKNFKKWKELGDSILKMDGVLSVISEATLFTINDNAQEERFEAKKIYSDPTFTEKSIDSIRKEVKKNPIYDHLLYNDSTHISMMMIGLDEEFLADQKKQNFVLELENFATTYENDLGHMHFAGLPHIRIVIGKLIINEMILFIGLSLVASCVLIYYFFRSFKVVLISAAVILISVVWALGTIGLFEFKLSVMMALIPPLMIVVGVPNVVFFYTRFHQEYRISRSKIRAVSSMVKKVGGATFLTNLTTAIGFCTFTSSEKLMEFGIIAALNIMVVFVLSICLIPIAISYSADPKEKHLAHLDKESSTKMLDIIVNLVTHHRKAIYIGSVILVVISLIGALNIKATGNLTSDLPSDDPIIQDLKYVENSFGGTIPFEVVVDYKTSGRLFKNETLDKIEQIQTLIYNDTLYSKSLSYVDILKVINMAMNDNNPEYFKIISNRDKLKLKRYMEKFDISSANGAGGFSLKELVDTNNTMIRIRTQMKDISSADVRDHVEIVKAGIDSILNPNKKDIERLYTKVEKNKTQYIDSILDNYNNVRNALTYIISNGNADLQYEFDMNPDKVKEYYKKPYFKNNLRAAIDNEYYGVTLTGTSVVAAEGTKYLFVNMMESIGFAILTISALMSLLFNSWKMTIISMIPNIIPLVCIAGFMGFFKVDLKPSTLLVFGIALGITVDNAILFLAKYRQEMRTRKWDIKYTIIKSLRETGLGIIYTSIAIFCGFSMFYFSKFGGTQAMGMLTSLAILVGTFTNLLILPALLLSLEKYVTNESFNEPYFEIYDEEEDIELDNLMVQEDPNLLPKSNDQE